MNAFCTSPDPVAEWDRYCEQHGEWTGADEEAAIEAEDNIGMLFTSGLISVDDANRRILKIRGV